MLAFVYRPGGSATQPVLRWARRMSTSSIDAKARGPAASLSLENGVTLKGYSFGAEDTAIAGECVFYTGMVGVNESLTDPSYAGQILVLTYPLIGNYGVPDRNAMDFAGVKKYFESDKIQVAGLVVQEYSPEYSHWDAHSSLKDWLAAEGIPAIHGVDTRMLTKQIREQGALLGKLSCGAVEEPPAFVDPNETNLIDLVSRKEVTTYGAGNPYKVLAVDCGIKNNMIRELVKRGAEVKVVPWDHDIKAEREWYDGLFLSNGPGDPIAIMDPLVENVRHALSSPDGIDKPVFGICMGSQVMGLATDCQTYKLPFGNRGQNQPVMNVLTNQAYMTAQNHGYAIDTATMNSEWEELFVNVNDGTNEGIIHKTKPFFSAQFHPEAWGGPVDTTFLFDKFIKSIKEPAKELMRVTPPRPEVSKVLILGSGGLSIGQAGEFDYSGSQAIKALKEEGLKVVLMNPNIASVQTNVDALNPHQADDVYFLPVTPEFVELIIKRERPDGILVSMGGQTALNCGVALHDSGILEKYDIKVLGTPIEAIKASEDREIFSEKLSEIGERIAQSEAVSTVGDALEAAKSIGYPLMIRSAYALGGLGSGICKDEAELKEMATVALASAPQILVEKSMLGWKELEYEVVRDAAGNIVTVCNMENFDPLGVHTGDSIVIAPSQTLSNQEYHMLRETAIKVVSHLGIVGECNIQYALDPHSTDYCIIEVNARLSRSSALASKATGYPLAAVAAKLSLGVTLPEIKNAVTKKTSAMFEPSLDYIVTKIPRWDLAKFEGVSPLIGSAMKSVGEVMAIGRTFEESLQKAVRMISGGAQEGLEPYGDWSDIEQLNFELGQPSDKRVGAIAHALRNKVYTVDELHDRTKIDKWFLHRLQRIISAGDGLVEKKDLSAVSYDDLLAVKRLGFSDKQIAGHLSSTEDEVRSIRKSFDIVPHVKAIDTLAAEFPAETNYLYTTYHGSEHDVEFNDKGTMVLGSGPYRIGSSVEFDWCAVSCIRTLRQQGFKSIVVNCNPETVSTDYDECDRLYFDELSYERVKDIYELENSAGVVVSVGGQTPNNLALPLHKSGVRVLGTSPVDIDNAEDRYKFSQLMDSIGVKQPAWKELTHIDEAYSFADEVGYPVLIRPSYVLSGAAMNIAETPEALKRYLSEATDVSPEHPVVITKFINDAEEIEFDGVARNGEIIAHAISEHIEPAGVHSGDANLILPPQTLSSYHKHRTRDIAARVAKALNISGPFNMQLIAKGADVSIIECNVRASRSFPFVSKTVGADFIEAATQVMLDLPTSPDLPTLDSPVRPSNFVGIKAPMFSFRRLPQADPVLGVEMASTGEVACFGQDRHEAYLKAILSAGFKLPQNKILLSVQDKYLHEVIHSAYKLNALGYELCATPKTHAFLAEHNVPSTLMAYSEDISSPVIKGIRSGEIDLVINLPNRESTNPGNKALRRTAIDFNVPLITNTKLVKSLADALEAHTRDPMPGLTPGKLADYYRKEAPTDAWTDPHEFH